MTPLTFPAPVENARTEALRAEVRGFLAEALASRAPLERAESWNGFDRGFSRAMGQRGWLGMTWPRRYGGQERTAFERYVVIEETLAAGAPVAAHWIADRQSGPTLLRYGTEAQKQAILPRIAAGECTFCIGMSEPDAGSDLAAVRTRADRQGDGSWRVNGTKLWTTYAHEADYMILFCRTSGTPADRHEGTSQLLVDMKHTPGLTVFPVHDLMGQHHFNEVHFEDARLPADALLGTEGSGWTQVMGELAYERSGPERFLSSIQLLIELIGALQGSENEAARSAIGRLFSHLVTLRHMSRGVASLLEKGENPSVHAAIVKDLGATFEQDLPDIARSLVDARPDLASTNDFCAVLAYTIMASPAFSLRGGTREILRGIIARQLGLR
ncbi:acyl-CoA dehydrogenase [Sphingobium jiangsuense]|uniref:Alkylation response protein AidB-like acyl-CoA dehydrogenase n=1 Tax=Sphingobium jiangsuense TaxID=870476 RepID=A0A7W6BQF9_9SPHN|nr:acyl-CoA dehydrogenase family protein [Sphingobium jiangsuense]MBB3926858.1 alkylation response protein AidB-like acyl-CoA dehydrogenase [Sphingobium jiangsuense]GLS98866.1 acyl-CoA dehydrogenase [Sphingobium jiangsuense]